MSITLLFLFFIFIVLNWRANLYKYTCNCEYGYPHDNRTVETSSDTMSIIGTNTSGLYTCRFLGGSTVLSNGSRIQHELIKGECHVSK